VGGSVVLDVEALGSPAEAAVAAGADTAAAAAAEAWRRGSGLVAQVMGRVRTAASSAAAAVRPDAAAGEALGDVDGDDGQALDEAAAASRGLLRHGAGAGQQAVTLSRAQLQLGALRPSGAVRAVRTAHPAVQTALAHADRAWVRVVRFASGSPASRAGLLLYLLVLHLAVAWIHSSCHHAAVTAVAAGGGAAGGGAAAGALPVGTLPPAVVIGQAGGAGGVVDPRLP
jgi:hypothetical protein